MKQLHSYVKHSVMATLLSLVCAPVFAQTPITPAAQSVGAGSLAGIWTNGSYKGSGRPNSERERVLQTVDGKWPPLLPWASELLEKRIRMSQEGSPFANTLTQCLPGGMPLMMFGASYPVQIIESSGQITMLFEEQNHFRIIHMNAKHPDDPDPTYMGHSVGHWEGNTLVVDTVGLTDRTTIDQIGTPHSEELHVVERYRRTDANALEIIVTIEDPKTFTKTWDAKAVYKTAVAGATVNEYICENNRNTPDAQGQTGFVHPASKP